MVKPSFAINLKEGTISFWIKAGKFDWQDDHRAVFLEASKKEGDISILKDEQNTLRASYQLRGQGKKELSVDVAGLSNKKDHQIGFTWSQKNNNISLYLDGEKVAEKKIK